MTQVDETRDTAVTATTPTRPPITSVPARPPAGPGSSARHAPWRRLLAVGVLLALLVGAALGYSVWSTSSSVGPLTASGTVEADEVLVGPEVAGRLVAVLAEEGRSVQAGDVLARLDDRLIQLQLEQADAASRRQLELQADRYVVRAPQAGLVTRVPGRVGEVVAPGATIAALADLHRLDVTLYVLERDLARVAVRQQVSLSAEGLPGRSFAGVVTAIRPRAEFTPRNVQTARDRQNLVFGVKVRVANPDLALKPGMPVDGTFAPLD